MRIHARLLPALLACTPLAATAADAPGPVPPPLRFAEFFTQPVGPRGLEPTARLTSLAGSPVQLVGHVAHLAEPLPDVHILAAVPVELGDEDESFADDLPPAVAYVHGLEPGSAPAQVLERCAGPVRVTGRRELGAQREGDGRTSYVRLRADAAQCLARDAR